MKKILPVIAIIAVVTLCLPFYGGVKAKQQIDSIVETLNTSPGYQAAYVSYEKSWLETNAVVNISFRMERGEEEEPFEVDVPVTIEVGHGPVLLNMDNKLGWFSYRILLSEEHSKTFSDFVTPEEAGDLVQFFGYMNLAGDTDIHNLVLPFSATDGDLNAAFAGFNGQGMLKSNGMLTYNGELGEISIREHDKSFVLAASTLSMTSDYSRMVKGANVMPSKGTMLFPKLQFTAEDVTSEVENIKMDVEIEMPESEPVMNMMVLFGAGKGHFSDEHFTDFTLSLAYERISLKLVERYVELVNSSAANPEAEIDPNQVFTPELLEEVLGYEPGLSLKKLSVGLKEGRVDFNFSARLQPVDGVAPEMLKANPMMALQGLKVAMDMRADKAVAEKIAYQQAKGGVEGQIAAEQEAGSDVQYTEADISNMVQKNADMTLQMLLGQKFIVEEGDVYKSTFALENGESMVNGNPLPLPIGALLGAGMGGAH